MNENTNYEHIMNAIQTGDIAALEETATLIEEFPNGKDDFVERHWITNIIDCGTYNVLLWALKKNIGLNFRDDEGYTPLHSAIERENSDRYNFAKTLIEHGADVNAHGINDWTPLHHAAAREDIDIIALLIEHGADLNARTKIDNYATPYEEAKAMGCIRSVQFFEALKKKKQ